MLSTRSFLALCGACSILLKTQAMVSGIKTRRSTFPSLDVGGGRLEPPWFPTQPPAAHTGTRLNGMQRETIFDLFDQLEDQHSAKKFGSMRYQSQNQEPSARLLGPLRNTEKDEAPSWWDQIFACIGADRSPSQNRAASVASSNINALIPPDRNGTEAGTEPKIQTAEKNGRSKSPTSSSRNSFDFVVDRFAEHGDVAEPAGRP